MLIGIAIGAVIVGGVWYSEFMIRDHGGAVAKVGNVSISHPDFLSELESTQGSQTLSQLVQNQLIEYGATKYHITASQSDLDAALTSVKQQGNFTSDAQLQAALTANHLTMAQLQKNLRTQVLAKKLSERGITVSDKEIQDYYDKNKSQMATAGKTPALKDVKAQISDAIMQSKAIPPAQLLASLAKEDPIQIMDSQYSDVKTTIENPAPAAAPGQ
jgi:foldase protein PrsA